MKRNLNDIALLLFLPALLMPGCKKKQEEKPAPVTHAMPAKPSQAQAPKPNAPVQRQVSSALKIAQPATQLDFKNRTDPFKPYVIAEPLLPKAETPMARREMGDVLPIQSYDLNKFRVAGIITGLKENKALVIDPTGKGYVVQQGMPLGNNDGRITRITANAVEVTETFKEGRGHLKKRKIALTLAKKR